MKQHIGSDGKARMGKRSKRIPRKRRLAQRIRAEGWAALQNATPYGEIAVWDRQPNGDRSGLVIGVGGPQGGISSNPALKIAYAIRSALNPKIPRRADTIVYDAAGVPIARIDPYTRVRRPYDT